MGPLALLILFGLFNDSSDCPDCPKVLVTKPVDYPLLLVGQIQITGQGFQAVAFLLHLSASNHEFIPPGIH